MKPLRALLFLLAALLPALAAAGGRLPCPEARVFDSAAVNLLVLPYRYTGNRYGGPDSAAGRLAALIQQEALFSMLKFGSVGATELIDVGGDFCDPRRVAERVLVGGSPDKVRPGHGLIVMWGRIYEQGGELYVQSYLRFLRRDRPEQFDVAMPGSSYGPPLQLQAALPVQAVAFAPRRFTQADLDEVARSAQKALLLHDDKRKPIGPLASSPNEPLAYGVTETSGDWMKVRSFISGRSGWVQARVETPAWSLRRFLPELAYLEGVAGYLRLRTADKVPLTTSPARQFAAVERGFADYEKSIGRDAAPEALALALQMKGVLLWTMPELRPSAAQARSDAARLFEDARAVLPESPGSRALAAVTSAYLKGEPAVTKDSLERINEGLLDALAVNAGYAPALRNLEKVYAYSAAAPAASPYGNEELGRRLQIVRGALK